MIHPVHLVGAGPGDPGLITVRGADVLYEANVVIADRLVAAPLLRRLGDDVELIVRGEHRSGPSQEEINRLLVEKARAGKRVVRLKGGDPFVFGRGGEEALALAEAGVPFVIVPGVTAGIAAPAYAGIPLTHREMVGAVAFITGHEAENKAAGAVDWTALATGATTLVLYMSVSHLDEIARRLTNAGRSASTPVAVIEKGTSPQQRVVIGTLGDIASRARAVAVRPPALTVVGEVVKLHEQLAWFQEPPLRGKRILLLHSRRPDPEDVDHDGWPFVELLEQKTGVAIDRVSPLIVEPLEGPIDEALARLDRYQWLALTSSHAADSVHGALRRAGRDGRALGGVRLACLGSAAISFSKWLRPEVVVTGGGEELADAILADGTRGPVLFPRATKGRDELANRLRAAGLEVDIVPAYQTRPVDLREVLPSGFQPWPRALYDAIAFTSPRGVEAWLASGFSLAGVLVGAIGKTTAAALHAAGVSVDVVASAPSYDNLLQALARALAGRGKLG